MTIYPSRTPKVSALRHFLTANKQMIFSSLLILTTAFLTPSVDAGSGRHSSTRNRLPAISDKRSLTRIATVTVANGSQVNEHWSVSTEGPTGSGAGDAIDVGDADEVDDVVDANGPGDDAGLSNPSLATVVELEDQVPAIPSSLRTKATATSIYVTWSAPKNSKIVVRGYTIGWGIGFPDVYSKVLDGKQRSYTIQDLQPGSEYVISLRAYNNMGDGQPAYDNVRTLQEDLSESSMQLFPPVGLKATVLSSSSVVLQWTDTSLPSTRQPTDSRIYVVRYTWNFRVASPKYKYSNSSKTTLLIDELKSSTQYEFAVKVVKGRQESTWSMSVVNTTFESVPSTAPRDLTVVPDSEGNPSTVRLQWQPPKQPNGQVNGYVILYTTDSSKSDRDWSVHPLMGDKMNAILSNLLPDTMYHFKIQARNEKGTGPLSQTVSFRTHSLTAPSMMNMTNKSGNISTQTLYAVIAGISAMTLVLLLVISLLLCRSKSTPSESKSRKGGYSSTASSSCSPLGSKNKRESRELHPPDLWIHHEQLELKSIDKNHPRDDVTPVLRTFQESPIHQLESNRDEQRKGIVSFTSDSLYDDIGRAASGCGVGGGGGGNGGGGGGGGCSIDPNMQSSYPSATSTIRRTARAKPIMIPATSTTDGTLNAISSSNTPGTAPGILTNGGGGNNSALSGGPGGCLATSAGASVFEASTGLSRAVYPRGHSYNASVKSGQLTFEMSDLLPPNNLYDPVSGNSIQLPYPTPNLVCNNNVPPSYSSSGNTSSCAMSPTDASSLIPSSLTTSSPSINNLTLRPLPGLQSLRSFSTLTSSPDTTQTLPSNTPKHIAVKPQINSSLSSNCTNSQGHLTSSEVNNGHPSPSSSTSSSSPLKKLNCNSVYDYGDQQLIGHQHHNFNLLHHHQHHHHQQHHILNYNDHSIGPGSTITTLTCNSKPVQHVVKPSFKADLECIKSNDELTRELDGIMKDLNAITAPSFEK